MNSKNFFFVTEASDTNPYFQIYAHIITNIIPNCDELVSCDFFDKDELGNPSTEYYIRYKNNLNIEERNELHFMIMKNISEYCKKSRKYSSIFHHITIILIKNEIEETRKWLD